MTKHIVVTGGAGFIGSHLTEALLNQGKRVTVLDDLSTGRVDNLDNAKAAKLMINSILDANALQEAFTNASLVFHLAAIPSVSRSVSEPLLSHAVNSTGTLMVLEAARRAGVSRVIYSASSSAIGEVGDRSRTETLYAKPLSPYAVAKYTGELYGNVYWHIHGLEVVSVRYFNVYGPRQRLRGAYSNVIPAFLEAGIQGLPAPIYGDGSQTRDFTYIADIIHSTLLAAEASQAPGLTINIGAGNPVSILNLSETIGKALDCDLQIKFLPPRPEDVHAMKADTKLAGQVLGFVPSTPLESGLRTTAEWFRRAIASGAFIGQSAMTACL